MVSIIMGIYNCSSTLDAAIDSIIAQTYRDWELIMCDDGSTDNTYDVALKFVERYPNQITLINHEKNLGLNQTLNDCIKNVRGEFIARMDGDDISLPNRLEKEMDAFNKEPKLAVVSCPMIYFDSNGDWATGRCLHQYPSKSQLVFGTVHPHAACMVKTSVIKAVGGYSVSKKLIRVEDWHLWIKIYSQGNYGKNLTEPLYKMRDDNNATIRRKFKYRFNEAYVSRQAVKLLGLPKWQYIYSLRFIIVGMLPAFIYNYLHRKKISQ